MTIIANMNGDSANLILDHLRATRGDIGMIKDGMTEIKQRVTTPEVQLGGMIGTEQSHYGQTMHRLDRFDGRLDRIEQRLNLADAPV